MRKRCLSCMLFDFFGGLLWMSVVSVNGFDRDRQDQSDQDQEEREGEDSSAGPDQHLKNEGAEEKGGKKEQNPPPAVGLRPVFSHPDFLYHVFP